MDPVQPLPNRPFATAVHGMAAVQIVFIFFPSSIQEELHGILSRAHSYMVPQGGKKCAPDVDMGLVRKATNKCSISLLRK